MSITENIASMSNEAIEKTMQRVGEQLGFATNAEIYLALAAEQRRRQEINAKRQSRKRGGK